MGRLARAGAPPARDWDAVAAHLARSWQPGDVAITAPAWLNPVARMHIAVMADLDAATAMDLASAPRAWVITPRGDATRGVEALARRGFVVDKGAAVVLDEVGNLDVRRYEQVPAVVVDRLVDHAPSVIAEVGETQGQGYAPRRCALLAPAAGGQVERVVSMTMGARFVGYVGLADVFTRRDVRAPARLRIERVGDDGNPSPLVDLTFGVDDGWVRFDVPTTPGPAQLVVVASSPEPGGRDRRVCVAAEARR